MKSDDRREEIIGRYDNGEKKLLVIYDGVGKNEVIVERITYNENGDIILLEKPLEKMKMVREYYEGGQISSEENFKDGKEDCKYTFYWENGEIRGEENYKDGKLDGKRTLYHKNGQKEWEETYKDGELIEATLWDEDGTKK